MHKEAKLSLCRTYRYALWRIWDKSQPYVLFIGLNPSTADETQDDPTLTRCINFATAWGYGGVCMANLFAYRATQPEDMKAAIDPIGPKTNQCLLQLANKAGIIVAAWGNDGSFMQRAQQVVKIMPPMSCLKINKSGQPAHPLYQKASTTPIPLCSR